MRLMETLKHWMGAYQQSTIVTVQILINNGYHDNDKRKDQTNPEQYKRKFTHGSVQKKRGVGSCPYIIKITIRIICMNLISYAEYAGQASKMNWCYEIKR